MYLIDGIYILKRCYRGVRDFGDQESENEERKGTDMSTEGQGKLLDV